MGPGHCRSSMGHHGIQPTTRGDQAGAPGLRARGLLANGGCDDEGARTMRVLVATTAGEGHFGPVVPFAIALRDAGHEVRVAAPESFEASVRRTGLDHVPVADAPPEVLGPIFSRLPSLSLEEANAVVFKEVFCGIDARSALPAMQAVADQWRPDLVLREVAEFSSLVVAERAGIPHAQVAL